MNAKRLRALSAVLFVLVAALGLMAPPAAAKQAANQVCAGGDSGKINVSDPPSVTVTAPAGMLIWKYCVKAGSVHNGFGPVYVLVDPPAAEVTITYPGKNSISHYSVYYMTPDQEGCPPGTVPNPQTEECDPEPLFDLCHENEDGTYDLILDVTQAELDTHSSHEGDVAPDADGACPGDEDPETPEPPEDEVLPDRIDRPSEGDEVLPDRQERPRVAGRALPFTGLDPTPFLALAGLLAASGASALVIARNKR